MAAEKVRWARSHYPAQLPTSAAQQRAVPYPTPRSVRYLALAFQLPRQQNAAAETAPTVATAGLEQTTEWVSHTRLAATAVAMSQEVQEICADSRWYVNPTETLHISLFHTGRPDEPRPLSRGGIDKQIEQARQLCASTLPVELVVEVRNMRH